MQMVKGEEITIYGSLEEPNCFYSRIIKLENGDLIATWMRSFPVIENWEGTKSFYFYKSTDDGKTWSFLSELNPEDYGFKGSKQGMPGLYVFPQRLGELEKGTIIFANNDWCVDNEYIIHTYISRDNGKSFIYHSSLTPRAKRPVWEPEFMVSADGRLVCYYSDERQEGYDQCIALEVSDDGGVTWGEYKIIIGKYKEGWRPGIDPAQWRPGMPRVIRLKNGKYFMVYENVEGKPNGVNTYRTSDDGINWGNPEQMDPMVATKTAMSFQSPEIAIVEDDTEYGKIFIKGMNDTCEEDLCFMSKNNGENWELVVAPLTSSRNEDHGSGWSGTFITVKGALLELNNYYNGEYNEIRCGRLELK